MQPLAQDKNAVYSLHQLQGDSSHGTTKTGTIPFLPQ